MGRQRMPLRVCDQSLDDGLCGRPIADPEKHGHRVNQTVAQVDWMSQLTRLIECLLRDFHRLLSIPLKPERASERDRCGAAAAPVESTDAVTIDLFSMPRRLRIQYCLEVHSGTALASDEVVGNAEHPVRHDRCGRIRDQFGDGLASLSEGECAAEISAPC